MSESIRVRVKIPMQAFWVADCWVPSDRLDDISGYLSDNDDVVELVQQNGWMESDQLLVLDAQIDG